MVRIEITTKKREELIDITSEVRQAVAQSNVAGGICIVYCPHTTAGLAINENADPSVKKDILTHLTTAVPHAKNYTHLEGNADSHIKALLTGTSLSLIIEKRVLLLGTWQGIYFCEYDGPRRRKIFIKILKDDE